MLSCRDLREPLFARPAADSGWRCRRDRRVPALARQRRALHEPPGDLGRREGCAEGEWDPEHAESREPCQPDVVPEVQTVRATTDVGGNGRVDDAFSLRTLAE